MNVMNTHAVLSYASQLVVDEASTRFLQHMGAAYPNDQISQDYI